MEAISENQSDRITKRASRNRPVPLIVACATLSMRPSNSPTPTG